MCGRFGRCIILDERLEGSGSRIPPGSLAVILLHSGRRHLNVPREGNALLLGLRLCCTPRGRFRTARAQRGHSTGTVPIIAVSIQVTTLKTTHLRNHAQSIQNSKIQTSDACHGSQGPKFCPL